MKGVWAMKRLAVSAVILGAVVEVAPAQDGSALYKKHCVSCHGPDLEGQPNWMERNEDGRLPAPPHDETGHTWHHSDRQLLMITRDGLAAIVPGYETDMPTFGDYLTNDEILAVLSYIKSHWPESARAYQQARADADPIE